MGTMIITKNLEVGHVVGL